MGEGKVKLAGKFAESSICWQWKYCVENNITVVVDTECPVCNCSDIAETLHTQILVEDCMENK